MANAAMTNWIVSYNNHASAAGSALAVETDIYAAYYATKDNLLEFKNSDHQIVFAVQAETVLTIRRADEAAEHGPGA